MQRLLTIKELVRFRSKIAIVYQRSAAFEYEFRRGTGRNKRKRSEWRQKDGGTRNWAYFGSSLLAVSWWATIKDVLNWEKVELDKDPIKAKIKQSWLLRKYHKRTEALQKLHEALEEAQISNNQLAITRIYDEMANTYYEMEHWDEADRLFREVMARLIRLHNGKERDSEFIGISLKLADLFARRGDLRSAEVGYKHCVDKQQQVVQDHFKKYLISHGALNQLGLDMASSAGTQYTDPIALYGMCLEAYAHFLLKYCDEKRMEESQTYVDEAIKIGYQIYGPINTHGVNLINNYGIACLWKNRFDVALRYFEEVINKALHIPECVESLPGYYCNYAETLHHCGHVEKALETAQKAIELARRNDDNRVLDYTKQFYSDLLCEKR